MNRLSIGRSLQVEVTWYDKVLVPPADKKYHGEVIGWRNSQIIISVKDYAVIRFWKKSGLEVGNRDYSRRGFSVNVESIRHAADPPPGVSVTFSDDHEVPILQPTPAGQISEEERSQPDGENRRESQSPQ